MSINGVILSKSAKSGQLAKLAYNRSRPGLLGCVGEGEKKRKDRNRNECVNGTCRMS